MDSEVSIMITPWTWMMMAQRA